MIFDPFMREGFMPLPVTFVSTCGRDGVRNVAPYSCIMPVLRPLDLICLASAKKRDTLVNVKDMGEFVVSLPGTGFADKVIPVAKGYAPEVDEFVEAGLEEKVSEIVTPPGVAGCYGWMECRLTTMYEESNYVLVIGKVLRLEIDDEYLAGDGSLDVAKARPLMMTGSRSGMNYCTIAELGKGDAYGAMFEGGKDPFARKYE